MKFDKAINLFELTEKVVHRFRAESNLMLTGYEFEFKFKRDWNCPIHRININCYIFEEEYAQTQFDKHYDTVDKVVDLLFVHLRDDAGMYDLKDGLIMAKQHSMETRTEALTQRIHALSKQYLESNGYPPLLVQVEEKAHSLYNNGFPTLQYQVYNIEGSIQYYHDLDFNLREFIEQDIIDAVEQALKKC